MRKLELKNILSANMQFYEKQPQKEACFGVFREAWANGPKRNCENFARMEIWEEKFSGSLLLDFLVDTNEIQLTIIETMITLFFK